MAVQQPAVQPQRQLSSPPAGSPPVPVRTPGPVPVPVPVPVSGPDQRPTLISRAQTTVGQFTSSQQEQAARRAGYESQSARLEQRRRDTSELTEEIKADPTLLLPSGGPGKAAFTGGIRKLAPVIARESKRFPGYPQASLWKRFKRFRLDEAKTAGRADLEDRPRFGDEGFLLFKEQHGIPAGVAYAIAKEKIVYPARDVVKETFSDFPGLVQQRYQEVRNVPQTTRGRVQSVADWIVDRTRTSPQPQLGGGRIEPVPSPRRGRPQPPTIPTPSPAQASRLRIGP